MTSVHPIIDSTVVQIDGLRSSNQQFEIQQSIEEHSDTGNHDAIKDSPIDTGNQATSLDSESEELEVKKIDTQTNSFNNEKKNSASSHRSTLSSKANGSIDRNKVNTGQQTIFKPIINGLKNSSPFINTQEKCKNWNNKKQSVEEEKSIEYERFTFIWSNLSYFVMTPVSRFSLRTQKKFILTDINGELKSNQLFGILGPSGAGKSSLLDCLSFKRLKNVSGEIKINGKLNKYKMVYIPQHDEYFEDLTCLEILVYASKLKNPRALTDNTLLTLDEETKDYQRRQSVQMQKFHHRVARNVLSLLGLTAQANTNAGRLSGGQKKRLSVAQELVVKPHIIFLDEPTSGLDSSSSFQCISLLSRLAKHSTPIAIVATIHQPNLKTLQLFDQIYVLSTAGKVVYNASPLDVVSRLQQENIEVPIHYNPADYLLELASGEYDPTYIDRMAKQVKRSADHALLNKEDSKDAVKAFEIESSGDFSTQFVTLFNRCSVLTLRNSMLTTNRILSHLFLAFFISWVFGPNVGKYADCPPKMSLLLDTEELNKLANHTIENAKHVADNMASIFFGILVMLLGSLLPVLITFPLEVKILQKEFHNGWYSVRPYFWARFLADLPLQIFVPLMYVAITYVLNSQPREEFRFASFSLIFVLTAVIAQCHGIIVSAIFSKDIMTAVYLGPVTALPLLLFSGFLVRIERMPSIIRPLTYLSYMRFAFEGMVISIYGLNRCGDEAVEQIERVRGQLDTYFKSLLNLVKAGINCEEDWDLNKQNLKMLPDLNLTTHYPEWQSINEPSQQLQEASNSTGDGISDLFNNMLDFMFNSQLDDDGKIIPRTMQLFDLKDAYLTRSMLVLVLFTVITRIISYYIIRYKANLRE